MGTALLWECFDHDFSCDVPLALVTKVMYSYCNTLKFKEGQNPVKKIILIPVSHAESFILHSSETSEDVDSSLTVSSLGASGNSNIEMGHFLALHSSMNSLRNEQMDVKISLDERFNVVEKELKTSGIM